jgi:D-alanyl-D-alanine carboxypeptidase (penicillin-binding protein 5/6)
MHPYLLRQPPQSCSSAEHQWPPLMMTAAILVAMFWTSSPSRAEIDPSTAPLMPSAGFTSGLKSIHPLLGLRPIAQSVLLKDLTTGQTIYEFEADRRLSPASLTKVMSALVILEYGRLQDYVSVSSKAASARKTRLRLRAGQVFALEDLVKAMLITSANDACLAAVEHVAESEEWFVLLMNTKARVLGLLDTHFSNACGFDAPDHYSTAADLATLSEFALRHPVFKAFVRSELEIITAVNVNRSYLLRNTNRLLGRMPGVEGVKTGFTSKAGRCLIAKVSQNGKQLLLVLLHTTRRWNTASNLIEYGFQHLDTATAAMQ